MPDSKVLKAPRVSRISVSLPTEVARSLDALVAARGFENRSQAVSSIVTESLLEYRREAGEGIMSGTITLFYNQGRNRLLTRIANLKRRAIDEVIGSLQIQLEANHIMEVIVVQGPVKKLQQFTNTLVACKGVKVGKLTLTAALIPPVHPLR
jgi:CopG family nickel-responsive transcriptional regulator